jgi:hypothetical protein
MPDGAGGQTLTATIGVVVGWSEPPRGSTESATWSPARNPATERSQDRAPSAAAGPRPADRIPSGRTTQTW